MPDLIVSEELLVALKHNYPLILVSNTNEAHINYVRANYQLLDHFDHYVFSYEVGSLKPDCKIFQHAITVSGFSANELFFTDDREENIRAARQLGMHAHQFKNQSQLVAALQQAGVTCRGGL